MPEPSLEKLTIHARKSFHKAQEIARATGSPTLEPLHLLLSLLAEHGGIGRVILENAGFDRSVVETHSNGKHALSDKQPLLGPTPKLSPAVKNILRRAYMLASRFRYPYVGTEHLVSAFLSSTDTGVRSLFTALHISDEKIRSVLESQLNFDHFPSIMKMFESPENFNPDDKHLSTNTVTVLDQYTEDMGADQYQDDGPLIGRERELERLFQVLSRRNKNNPILIGEPGVGKTALVAELAKRLADGRGGAFLRGKRILSLDLALVVAGTNFRGEFEARIKDIIHEATEDESVILFIDEIHTIIGAGNTNGGLDAANILKPALARGDIQCIGATTIAEYKRHIEKDPALERRFQSILVAEPTPEEAKHILSRAKSVFERFHIVNIPKESINLAVDMSVRHLSDRFLPDKAFDIIDEASSLVRRETGEDPLSLELYDLEERADKLAEKKSRLVTSERYENAAGIDLEQKMVETKILAIGKKMHSLPINRPEVTERHIFKTISQMTGIPFAKLERETPRDRLATLGSSFRKKLIGQKEAVEKIEMALSRTLSGIGDPDRPLGSFLFLGPTGVGKTLAAKILAEEFFGDTRALIRLDMSEFMERHSVAQILGAPAGYVGYGEGGKLTEAVRRRPHCVVLFDEIEKAHPDVWNILLQILDEGTLTDAEGRKISFKNTIVILTSNIGTASFTRDARFGFEHCETVGDIHSRFEIIRNRVLEDLKKTLRPELLARLDHTIVFDALDHAGIANITRLELDRLRFRLKKQGIVITLPISVIDFIAEKSFAPEQGGRLVRKNVENLVEHSIATALIEHPEKKTLVLSVKNDVIVCK